MTNDNFELIDTAINKLISDTTHHNYDKLKDKVKTILADVEMFKINGELDSKAVDLYVKKVITKRNALLKQEEQNRLSQSKETKYSLIESICQKHEFQTKEELIQKLEELEKKSIEELKRICASLNQL